MHIRADSQIVISGVNFLPRNLVTFLLAKGILTMTETYAQACNSVLHAGMSQRSTRRHVTALSAQACNSALRAGMQRRNSPRPQHHLRTDEFHIFCFSVQRACNSAGIYQRDGAGMHQHRLASQIVERAKVCRRRLNFAGC